MILKKRSDIHLEQKEATQFQFQSINEMVYALDIIDDIYAYLKAKGFVTIKFVPEDFVWDTTRYPLGWKLKTILDIIFRDAGLIRTQKICQKMISVDPFDSIYLKRVIVRMEANKKWMLEKHHAEYGMLLPETLKVLYNNAEFYYYSVTVFKKDIQPLGKIALIYDQPTIIVLEHVPTIDYTELGHIISHIEYLRMYAEIVMKEGSQVKVVEQNDE